MRVRVLGPLEAEVDGEVLDLGAPKPRQLLATLALYRGQPVSVDTLAESLWGTDPPASHVVTIQGYVAGLRRVIEPRRAPRGAGTLIQTSSLGYRLNLAPDACDAIQLERAVMSGSSTLRSDPAHPWLFAAPPTPELTDAVSVALDGALAHWRGEPYPELGDVPAVVAERARLHELRSAAVELRELIRMHQGDPAEAARRLEVEATAHPLRERLWLLYAAALVRAQRQVDALAALRTLRDTLRDELGVDASAGVGELETAILQQRLDVAKAPAPAKAARTTPTPEAKPPLGVAVVDDHPMFRMGMTGLIGSLDGLTLVGAAGDAASARDLIGDGVDVVLMDLDLAGESGIELTAELLASHPDLKVLVMTMHEDDAFVSGALAAGAAGYLLKSADADDVHRAILGVARGELIIGSAVARSARSRLGRP